MTTSTLGKYVRINSRFKLRGWLGQPYALVDSLRAIAYFVPEGAFDTLRLCNGAFRPKDAVFFGPRQRQLEQLAYDGVLEFTDEPRPLEPDQEYRYYPNHYMRQVQWSMTGRCNYRCRHCCMSAPHAVLPQPSTEECLRIVDQMAECGVQVVKLTGGECLIRPDFLQVVDHLLANGIQIATIITNGALVTEELLDAFEERGVLCGFDISFDGTDGWHDWLRGVPGAEKATVRAFELCRDRGFPTGAEIVLHKGNACTLRKTVRLLGDLGVMAVVVGPVKAEGEALGIGEQLLDADEFFDICCAYLPQFLEDGAPVPVLSLGNYFKVTQGVPALVRGKKDEGQSYAAKPSCGAIRSTMYLGSDGFILPCVSMAHDDAVKESFPVVGSMTLAEALTDSSYFDIISTSVGDVLERNPKCRACAYKSRCLGGCRAKGVDDEGNPDPMGVDLDACRYFLGGNYDRARKVLERFGG